MQKKYSVFAAPMEGKASRGVRKQHFDTKREAEIYAKNCVDEAKKQRPPKFCEMHIYNNSLRCLEVKITT